MSQTSPSRGSRWRKNAKLFAMGFPFALLALPVVVIMIAAMIDEKLRFQIAGAFVGGMASNIPAIVIVALVGLGIAWLVITSICIRERWTSAASDGDQRRSDVDA